MKKIETFIFVHDQKIILDFILMDRFSDFEDFKYVFLGNNDCDLVKDLPNVIIARNIEHNIEEYPKLTSYTGWYALYKNNLINSEYVNFFEYDVNYIDGFSEINKEMLNLNCDFIGYFPMRLTDPVYLNMSQYTDSLIDSIKIKTGVNIHELINKKINENPNAIWSSSSNSTWKVTALNEYINWFSTFIDDIKTNQFSGHMHERSISFYYYLFNKKVKVVNGLMTHFQLNSHGTSPLPIERGVQLYKMLK